MAAFKWTGAILVLFSAGGLGIWSAMQWKGRLRMLETLRQMIYFLKGEITYSRAPLAEALERVGKREPGPMGSLFEQSIAILLDIIVLCLMEKHGISSDDMYRNHSNLE